MNVNECGCGGEKLMEEECEAVERHFAPDKDDNPNPSCTHLRPVGYLMSFTSTYQVLWYLRKIRFRLEYRKRDSQDD
jgi:hypothetical protein